MLGDKKESNKTNSAISRIGTGTFEMSCLNSSILFSSELAFASV